MLTAGRDHLVPWGGLVRLVGQTPTRGDDPPLIEMPYVDHAFDTVDGVARAAGVGLDPEALDHCANGLTAHITVTWRTVDSLRP